MKFKPFGKTGIRISSICLGTMTFGDGADDADCRKIYALARDHGINLFDCANVYADGRSERILGRLVRDHRHEIVLTTKAFYPVGEAPNARGLSRMHLHRELNASLARLGTDYIDIYFLHAFDPDTPIEESMATLTDFVRQGKILYVGLSNFAAWQVMKAIGTAERMTGAGVHCIQPMYNLLKRQAEAEILPMADHESLGVLAYGPIAGGLLTGKYLNRRPDIGRFTENDMYRKRYQDDWVGHAVARYCELAQNYGYHPASLAIAWAGAHPAVTAPLIGARTPDHLATGLAALDIRIDDTLSAELADLAPAPANATDRSEEAI